MRSLAGRLAGAAAARGRAVLGQLTASSRTLPDFLIIGTQRGGTASLYYNLTRHPGVLAAARKEVHFFDLNYLRGTRWYRGHFPTHRQMAARRERTGTALTGEASPYYLFHPAVPVRVRAVLPAAKLIVLLRNPVDRAYSHYQREVGKGRESRSFEDAVAAERERLRGEAERLRDDETYVSDRFQRESYLTRGIYLPQLQAWLAEFSRTRFLVLESERFFDEPGSGLTEVGAFLGLPAWTPSERPQKFNVQSYSQLPPALHRQLEDFFAPHNAALESALGRRFSWGPS
jgi:hypothetical protein